MLLKTPVDWQYNGHADFSDALLTERSVRIVSAFLSQERAPTVALMRDTRPLHAALFDGLTPVDMPYFAGHYRGEPFANLQRYVVYFGPNKGVDPWWVLKSINQLSDQIRDQLLALEKLWDVNVPELPMEDKLVRLAEVGAAIFERFLTIHPYADGNGHISRMLLVALCSLFGLRAVISIHPRPTGVPLAQLLQMHRTGNRRPLVMYILQII